MKLRRKQDDFEQEDDDDSIISDVRKIVGGVVGLALVIVPVILIRKLVRTIEESEGFQSLNEKVGKL